MTRADADAFRDALRAAVSVVVLTGAGVSAESGIPTFRGAGGLWRRYEASELANPAAWERNPGLVWEFYNYRRRVMADKLANPAHHAIARLERALTDAGRSFRLITQNIDDLHLTAGSQRVTRLHGSIWQVRCCYCSTVARNHDVPIAPAFEGQDVPDEDFERRTYTDGEMPHCTVAGCHGVVRPDVVWFGESLDANDIGTASDAAQACDLFIVVGTSAVVYPAAAFGPLARSHGAALVEVNLDATPITGAADYAFEGKAGELLPDLFDVTFD